MGPQFPGFLPHQVLGGASLIGQVEQSASGGIEFAELPEVRRRRHVDDEDMPAIIHCILAVLG